MKRYFLLVLIIFAGLTLYAQEEKLKPEEAEELIQKYIQEEQDLTSQLDALTEENSDLEAEISALDTKIENLENKLAMLKKKLEEMSYYVVKSGDWLARIAEKVYGPGNANRWKDIYEANKDKIKDPDLIYSGWKLFIPRP